MVCDTARGHLSAYLSSPGDAVMDHTLHLHLHLYADMLPVLLNIRCLSLSLSLSNIGNTVLGRKQNVMNKTLGD